MPDLNDRNRAVRDEMASVVTRWLNFGFDGLRVDAVKYLVEGSSPSQWKDQPETLAWPSVVVDFLDGTGSVMAKNFLQPP